MATKAATATAIDRAGSYLESKIGTARPEELAAKVATATVDAIASKIADRAPPSPPPPDGGPKLPVSGETAILSGILINEIVKQFQRRNGNGNGNGNGAGEAKGEGARPASEAEEPAASR